MVLAGAGIAGTEFVMLVLMLGVVMDRDVLTKARLLGE